jgi:hypothetical protein
MARLVLNVLLLAGESLPRGGVLTLSGDAKNHVVAEIVGPGAAWPERFCQCVEDAANAEPAWATLDNPRDLQGPLTAVIARTMGMRISLMTGSRAAGDETPPPLLLAPATSLSA